MVEKNHLKKELQEKPLFLDCKQPLSKRVDDLIARLTLEEKLILMTTRQAAIIRLGVPEFSLGGEAAHGLVTEDGKATVFPQTIGLACTWDEDLLHRIGEIVGTEARIYYKKRNGSGGLCLWAPTVDLVRDPRWGRCEEGYGEDALLTARLAGAYIRGLQGNHPFYLRAVATLKHFYANNNETERGSFSASISEFLKREYYLKPYKLLFQHAKPYSLMTAYNAINEIPAMLHPDLMEIVKNEWGMEGFVVSDDTAFSMLVEKHKFCKDYVEAVVKALKAGIDNITDDKLKVRQALKEALAQNLLSEKDLDKALKRVFAIRFKLGQFDSPQDNPFTKVGCEHLLQKKQKVLALEAAKKAIVLLKNDPVGGQRILPFNCHKIKKIAVLGPLADVVYRDWYGANLPYKITPLNALSAHLGPEKILYHSGTDLVRIKIEGERHLASYSFLKPALGLTNEPGEIFRLTEWNEGWITLQSLYNLNFVTLTEDGFLKTFAREVWGWYVKEIFKQEKKDNEQFYLKTWNGHYLGLDSTGFIRLIKKPEDDFNLPWLDPSTQPLCFSFEWVEKKELKAEETAGQADLALVFLGCHPLIGAKEEIDRTKLELPLGQLALLESTLKVNPKTVGIIISGYPQSFGKTIEKLPALIYTAAGGQEAGQALCEMLAGDYSPAGRLPLTWYNATEELGSIFDYDIKNSKKTYLYFDKKPLFAFGHGLSYANFKYSQLKLSSSKISLGQKISFTFFVKNESPLLAEEVVQVYGSWLETKVEKPLKELLGFKRISLKGKQKQRLNFEIDNEQLLIWDSQLGRSILPTGKLKLQIGSSSDNILLWAEVEVEGEAEYLYKPKMWFNSSAFIVGGGLKIKEEINGKSFVFPAVFTKTAWFSPGNGFFEKIKKIKIIAKGNRDAGWFLTLEDGQKIVEYKFKQADKNKWQTLDLPCSIPDGEHKLVFFLERDCSLERFIFY